MDTMDTVDTADFPRLKKSAPAVGSHAWQTISAMLLTWEIYPLVLVAAFLRLFYFSASEYDADQAAIFSLARNAVVHGLIPVTTNTASIHILNPPATVYLLMLGALFSSDPAAGVIVTAVLSVLAVLFTYMVVRRYYGRVAGTVAALLYAVAPLSVFYSSFLWNQNLLAPFVPLFLLALLWGVVERRQGWLAPAVLLWGWMIQLHGSAVLLAIPLALACLLAFRTLRWRDVFLAATLLVAIYIPYIVWEFVSHFSDVHILLHSVSGKSVIDSKAIHGYLDFLLPYASQPTDPLSWQYKFYPVSRWGYVGMVLLAGFAFLFLLFAVWQDEVQLLQFVPRGARLAVPPTSPSRSFWSRLRSWWTTLQATPWRRGLLVLLVWQVLPVIYLSRHSLRIFDYYLLVLMPGPFIIIGIFAAQVATWLRSLRSPWPLARLAFYLLLVGLAFTLSLASVARTIDRANGLNNPSYTYYMLQDTQYAIDDADHLAQVYHAHHVYIARDVFTSDALIYLSDRMQTPHTTYNSSNCLPLPGVAQGPALMLLGPADWSAQALFAQVPSARLVSSPPRPGGPPFHLYLVQSGPSTASHPAFVNQLAFAAHQPQISRASGQVFMLWNVLRDATSMYGTTYNYRLKATFHGGALEGKQVEDVCSLSNLQTGELLLTAFNLPMGAKVMPSSLSLTGTTWTTTPYVPTFGPFHLETFLSQSSTEVPLQSSSGGMSVRLQG